MEYNEWLIVLEKLTSSNSNIDLLNTLKNTEINPNFNDILIPKIENMITSRFQISIDKIIKDLEYMFTDTNFLDLSLLNLKKEINYTLELCRLKQLPIEKQELLEKNIKEETKKTYEILINQANKIDYTGSLATIINNNKIKWSE